jgi:hypothetical protein
LYLRVRVRVADGLRERERYVDADLEPLCDGDRIRDDDRDGDRVREGVPGAEAVCVGERVGVPLRVRVTDGSEYAQDRPVAASEPGAAPTWMKKKRDSTLASVTVDADGLLVHRGPLSSPALSLPARHWKLLAPRGQPSPT